MRLISLAFKSLALLVVYAFACGALVQQGTIGEAYWHSFFAHLLAPLNGLHPASGAVLVAGAFLFGAGLAIAPKAGRGEYGSPWPSLILAAFVVDALAVCATVAFIFAGPRYSLKPAELGALYAAGVFEAALGTVLATSLFFMRRPRLVYLPALGLLLAGIGVLGAMFWLGNGA